MKIAIISINNPSLNSACKLASYLKEFEVDVYGKEQIDKNILIFDKLDDILKLAWQKYDSLIFIVALGIVVRKIAPLLQDKSSDPAVIIMNLPLNKVIPLLSGHLGGANELADIISKKIPNCINFITTATDQTNTLAFEMWGKKNNMEIENLKELANISNRLLNRQLVKVATYKNLFDSLDKKENLKLISFEDIDKNSVVISPNFKSSNLTLKPKIYLGIGMNRGVSLEKIEEAIEWFLKQHSLEFKQIANIGSFEAKKDEIGLIKFAEKYNFDIEFFNKEMINSVIKNLTSSQATKFFQIKGVAEPSAILLARYQELIIPKEIYEKQITIAGAI